MKTTIEVSKAVSENLQSSGAAAVPWVSILELVMTLLGGNCFKQQNALSQYAEDVKKDDDIGAVKKVAALIVIRRELGVRRREAKAIRDEMFSAMEVMEPEDLTQIQTEVNNEILPTEFLI